MVIDTKMTSRNTTNKKTPKQLAIDEVFKPDKDGLSEWITREVIQLNKHLDWGKNGLFRHGIPFGDNRYIWEKKGKQKIIALKLNGFNNDKIDKSKRPIGKSINKYYKTQNCVVCGSNSDLVVDHKNDLYNDTRVLDIKRQNLEDFQCLCNHCNLQKRQISKKEKEEQKLYSAKNILTFKILPFDFPWEKKIFDKEDIDCKKDTYWYDPIEFMNKIYLYSSYRIPINDMIKKNVKLIN